MGAHAERRDRAGEAERPTQAGSGSSSGKSRSCSRLCRARGICQPLDCWVWGGEALGLVTRGMG